MQKYKIPTIWSLYLSDLTKVQRKEKRGEEGERREGRNTFLSGAGGPYSSQVGSGGGSQDSELAGIRRGDAGAWIRFPEALKGGSNGGHEMVLRNC